MSPGNLKESVAEELSVSARLLKAAEALIAAECYPDSTNRSYYAVFHLSVAMLLVVGQEPRSHAGAKALLGSSLVRPGLVPERAAEIFAALENVRMASDYRRFFVVTREETEAILEQAREFQTIALAFLSSQGF